MRPGVGGVMSESGRSTIETLAGFFAEERRNLVGYLRRRARALEEMDAEDIVSEVALRLFERPDLVGDVENLAAYVIRALQRRVVDWVRERKRLAPLDERTTRVQEAADGEEGIRPSIARAAEDAEFRRRFFAALAALPPPQRAIWIATQLEGHTFQEMAERWGVPLGTLLARKHRANEFLRSALRDLWDGAS